MEVLLAAMAWGGLALASTMLGVVGWLRAARRRHRGWKRHGLGASMAVAAVVLAVVGLSSVYALWYRYRPSPEPFVLEIAPGITVEREVRDDPRPMVIHVATIDLRTAELEVVTTPPAAPDTLHAITTSDFARAHAVDVAINANFFHPFESNNPWSYYPEVGDPVEAMGIAAAEGVEYGRGTWHDSTAYFGPHGAVSFFEKPDAIVDAVAGRAKLLEKGRSRVAGTSEPAPRTAIGLSQDRTTLWLVTVDGRQPGYSEGMKLRELARLLRKRGAYQAIELDGGGSTTMAIRRDGTIDVVNSPIHTRIPGRERPVANHLGFRVAR